MTNELLLKKQFQDILLNYRTSEEASRLLKKSKIALFDGPSASGRNTLISNLLKNHPGYQLIVSDTTRKPRKNNDRLEMNGIEYWFKSETEFLEGLKNGNYIEAAIIHDQQVSGVNVSEIIRASKSDKIAINDVQPDGIEAFRKVKPDTRCFFILPPTFNIWESRLNARGKMHSNERIRRYTSAIYEIEHALSVSYYKFIINSDLKKATKLVNAICSGEDVDTRDARGTAVQLLNDTKDHLKEAYDKL